uniref:Uncharacterized protein n=1 Tax=Meloidogyne enterolobii TaxID=390850 RepID=A0A6V7XJP9_MELEN|nr:unnamed protein product [Meloidogyne enterolobii]CAD2199515.1 unnamed protein product [Meloidogyne enterolobii]
MESWLTFGKGCCKQSKFISSALPTKNLHLKLKKMPKLVKI